MSVFNAANLSRASCFSGMTEAQVLIKPSGSNPTQTRLRKASYARRRKIQIKRQKSPSAPVASQGKNTFIPSHCNCLDKQWGSELRTAEGRFRFIQAVDIRIKFPCFAWLSQLLWRTRWKFTQPCSTWTAAASSPSPLLSSAPRTRLILSDLAERPPTVTGINAVVLHTYARTLT